MNFTNFTKYFDKKQITRKNVIGAATATFVCLVALVAFAKAPITKINGTSFTYADISDSQTVSGKMAGVVGAKKTPTAIEVFQSLVIAGVEKEILASLKTQINSEVATRMILENSPYRGLLEKEKQRLGDERFFKLFIEPAAVGELFQQYYNNKDPQRQVAVGALALAKSIGLTGAAQKTNVPPQEMSFARDQRNEALYASAKQVGAGNIIDSVIEDGNNFFVVQVVELTDRGVRASAITLPRSTPGDFLAGEMKAKNISVKDSFYSLYRMADLTKPGMIFAAKVVAEEKKDAKK